MKSKAPRGKNPRSMGPKGTAKATKPTKYKAPTKSGTMGPGSRKGC